MVDDIVIFDGAFGTEGTGVTGFDGLEAGPVPLGLIAATVNVYGIPFVRPFTTMGIEIPFTGMPGVIPLA